MIIQKIPRPPSCCGVFNSMACLCLGVILASFKATIDQFSKVFYFIDDADHANLLSGRWRLICATKADFVIFCWLTSTIITNIANFFVNTCVQDRDAVIEETKGINDVAFLQKGCLLLLFVTWSWLVRDVAGAPIHCD